ncbi:MAG: hypothetical protein IKA82_00635 [Clostridia bacterium]|nr:hypothetical protein [Clostridia bacterium]
MRTFRILNLIGNTSLLVASVFQIINLSLKNEFFGAWIMIPLYLICMICLILSLVAYSKHRKKEKIANDTKGNDTDVPKE